MEKQKKSTDKLCKGSSSKNFADVINGISLVQGGIGVGRGRCRVAAERASELVSEDKGWKINLKPAYEIKNSFVILECKLDKSLHSRAEATK